MLLEPSSPSERDTSLTDLQQDCIETIAPQPVQPKVTKLLHRARNIIYEAVDENSGQKYALKLFPYTEGKASNWYYNEKRFKNLVHPHVIRIHDAVEMHKERDIDHSSLLMDLGICDFEALIRSKTFKQNEKLARTYFHQLIDGVEYIHKQGVYHLDLKPENLLLGDDYLLKITDFDHSYMTGDSYIQSVGTINYRAPELFNRSACDLAAVDVYSMAIILFVWVVGYMPYLEDKLFNKISLAFVLLEMPEKFFGVYEEIIKNSVSVVSSEFQELFLGMTNKNANKRITIKQIKESNWFRGPVYSLDEIKNIPNFSKFL
jgi:serine/threonine protein kinase